jgi:hypothetical protein
MTLCREAFQAYQTTHNNSRSFMAGVEILPRCAVFPLTLVLGNKTIKERCMKKISMIEIEAHDGSILRYARVLRGLGTGRINYQAVLMCRLPLKDKFSAYSLGVDKG